MKKLILLLLLPTSLYAQSVCSTSPLTCGGGTAIGTVTQTGGNFTSNALIKASGNSTVTSSSVTDNGTTVITAEDLRVGGSSAAANSLSLGGTTGRCTTASGTSTCVGDSSSIGTSSTQSTLLGDSSAINNSAPGCIAVGHGNTCGGNGSHIVIGNAISDLTAASSITIGLGSTPVASTIIIGDTPGNGTTPDAYIGMASVTAAAPVSATFHGQGGSGSNINGGTLSLADGLSTGTGTPGAVGRRYGLSSTTSSSTANTLSTNKYTLGGTLFTQFSAVTVTNTASSTTILSGSILGTKNVEANILQAGQHISCHFAGTIANTLTPNLTFLVSLGGTTVATTGAFATATTTGTQGWRADVDLVTYTIGATGTIQGSGTFWYDTTGTGGVTVDMVSTSPTTINTTAIEAIDAQVQWGAASASNTLVTQVAACAYVQ